MADLVTLAELKLYLGIDTLVTTDDALLTALLDDVEALFESATLRPPGFYTAGDTITETLSGTGTPNLWVSYPIAVDGLVSVTLGYGTSTETVDLANLVYGEGSRCLTRTDGGVFGSVSQRRYVTVEYEHADALAADAKLAVMSVVKSVYDNRGSGSGTTAGMKSETIGSFYSYTRDDVSAAIAVDSFWQQAVESNRPVVIA
jgi:hypothetical protein